MTNKENLMREIYWIFRSAIHNGHMQIKIEDGKAEAFIPNKIKFSSCYVCDILHNVEKEIGKLFGEEYYTCGKIAKSKTQANPKKDLSFNKGPKY